MAKNIISEYRKQPGPGEYEHSHYSDFAQTSASSNRDLQRHFGISGRFSDIPDFLKAPGIGNSCKGVAPNSYKVADGPFDDIKLKMKLDKFSKVAVNQWHERLFENERKKFPTKYPQFKAKNKSPSPGPG